MAGERDNLTGSVDPKQLSNVDPIRPETLVLPSFIKNRKLRERVKSHWMDDELAELQYHHNRLTTMTNPMDAYVDIGAPEVG